MSTIIAHLKYFSPNVNGIYSQYFNQYFADTLIEKCKTLMLYLKKTKNKKPSQQFIPNSYQFFLAFS